MFSFVVVPMGLGPICHYWFSWAISVQSKDFKIKPVLAWWSRGFKTWGLYDDGKPLQQLQAIDCCIIERLLIIVYLQLIVGSLAYG